MLSFSNSKIAPNQNFGLNVEANDGDKIVRVQFSQEALMDADPTMIDTSQVEQYQNSIDILQSAAERVYQREKRSVINVTPADLK